MKLVFFVTLLIAGSLLVNLAQAQKKPMKFGKPTKEELEMKFCPFDSSAPAMILCDYGYFHAERFEFDQMIRIKFFKKEGYEWANFKNRFFEKLPQIAGYTYNLENGEIVEEKLKQSAIFQTRTGKESLKISFALPNVKEGSVIDVKISYQGFPKDWFFQRTIPVAWSELLVDNSQYIRFRQNFFGYIPMAVVESNRWVSKNVPAFVEEPHLSCRDNYISKCEFEVYEVDYPGYHKSYTTNWETLNEHLKAHDHFGGAMGVGLYLNSVAKEMRNNSKTDDEKIKKAHDFIKQMKWNGDNKLYISKTNLSEVYDERVGNAADINLMLVMLLRKLDFDANPLILSTVDNGILSKNFPSLERLNYVLANIKFPNGSYINLDATESLLPYNILPERCLNGFGVIVKSGNPEFVDLKPTKSNQISTLYNLELNDDLTFKGKISSSRIDYAAFDFRKSYYDFNGEDEFINDLKKSRQGLIITDHKLNNLKDEYTSMKDEYDVKIEGKCEEVGNEIYFNTLFYEGLKENPFKLEERAYPVEFVTSSKSTYTLMLKIPDNYTIVQKPADITLKTPDNGALFMYQVTQNGNNLIINSKFNITKNTFYVTDYPYLKEFYDRVVKKNNEPIILKRN